MYENKFTRTYLEKFYQKYNRREFVHPDPLEFLYNYDDPADREIVGLVASSLAYGRVAQILKSVSTALAPMGGSPHEFILDSTPHSLAKAYSGFKHRFTASDDLAALLAGIRSALKKHGSLKECFSSKIDDKDITFLPALSLFVDEITDSNCGCCYLAPSPKQGSACKRLNLFLRWMVRRDDVDPGGWDELPKSKLVVPLDTHMFRIATAQGMTLRKQADLKTAVEMTEAFRIFAPEDPVKYDFSLTRPGIWNNTQLNLKSSP